MAKVQFKKRTKTSKLIVHCSATKPSMDIGAREIRIWHKTGNGWLEIGYHYVIRRNGEVENGRPDDVVGAHCHGHNLDSVGICLVGGIDEEGNSAENFTKEQFDALRETLLQLQTKYSNAKVFGHRDFAAKDCPCFDVHDWLAELEH